MSLTFGFYNSLNGDRKYNAEQISAIFDGLIHDGVFDSIGNIFATTPGEGLQVIVGSGKAWFHHTWNVNDTALPLSLEAPDILLPRIDAVVLEINNTKSVRANSIKILKGTPGSTPQKPALARTAEGELEGVNQYALAYVTVDANATEITTSKIEINVGKSDCPFVTSIVQSTDIDALFNQWNGEFDEWFENLKTQLTDNVVANLQRQIDENKTSIESLEEEVDKQKEINKEIGLIKSSNKMLEFVEKNRFYLYNSKAYDSINSGYRLAHFNEEKRLTIEYGTGNNNVNLFIYKNGFYKKINDVVSGRYHMKVFADDDYIYIFGTSNSSTSSTTIFSYDSLIIYDTNGNKIATKSISLSVYNRIVSNSSGLNLPTLKTNPNYFYFGCLSTSENFSFYAINKQDFSLIHMYTKSYSSYFGTNVISCYNIGENKALIFSETISTYGSNSHKCLYELAIIDSSQNISIIDQNTSTDARYSTGVIIEFNAAILGDYLYTFLATSDNASYRFYYKTNLYNYDDKTKLNSNLSVLINKVISFDDSLYIIKTDSTAYLVIDPSTLSVQEITNTYYIVSDNSTYDTNINSGLLLFGYAVQSSSIFSEKDKIIYSEESSMALILWSVAGKSSSPYVRAVSYIPCGILTT